MLRIKTVSTSMVYLLKNYLQPCLFAFIVSLSANSENRNHSFNDLQKQEVNNGEEWVFNKAEGHVLKFKNGKSFNTNLYDLKYIGQIANDRGAPFLIFSGRDCDECDANISLYIHSPSNGKLQVANGENRYGYPGTERDFENNSLLYRGRAFYGEVLPNIKGVLWYQEQRMENEKLKKSLFLVKLKGGVKNEVILKNTGQLQSTLGLLSQGRCKEIRGRDYTSEP
ncbi:MAG: hypothetical protein NVSMB24_14950 [Mucilaginibacter sp.]